MSFLSVERVYVDSRSCVEKPVLSFIWGGSIPFAAWLLVPCPPEAELSLPAAMFFDNE